jgi:hypothetical protein
MGVVDMEVAAAFMAEVEVASTAEVECALAAAQGPVGGRIRRLRLE